MTRNFYDWAPLPHKIFDGNALLLSASGEVGIVAGQAFLEICGQPDSILHRLVLTVQPSGEKEITGSWVSDDGHRLTKKTYPLSATAALDIKTLRALGQNRAYVKI